MTDDPKAPRPRQSLLLPVLIPVVILAGIGLILWGFSRLLLQMEPHAATATALVTAAGIVTVVAIVASRKRVSTGSLLTVGLGVCGIAMLASGAAILLGTGEEGTGGEAVVLTITAPPNAALDNFQETSLTAPSDTAFTIQFDNQDPGVSHDVIVASDDPAKDPSAQTFVDGTPITGVASTQYPAPALAAGKYYFFCSIHPTQMFGTLTTSPGASTEGGGGGTSTSITASGIQFDTNSLTFEAGKPTDFTFNNDDAGIPHNLAIYTDDTLKDSLFTGKIVTGVAKGDYTIPALKQGTYYFHCDVHPTMNGTVTVTPGSGEGGGGPPPSGPPSSGEPPPTSASPSSGAPPPSGGTTTTVTASGLAFDTTTINLPANKATTLTFDNEDASVPHDIAIFPDASATDPLFTGEIVTGVKTVDYNIPALKPGSYYFHCDVHPQMNGTVTVG